MDLSPQQVDQIAQLVADKLRPEITCESAEDHSRHHAWVHRAFTDGRSGAAEKWIKRHFLSEPQAS